MSFLYIKKNCHATNNSEYFLALYRERERESQFAKSLSLYGYFINLSKNNIKYSIFIYLTKNGL